MVETDVDQTKPNIYMKVLEAEQKLQDNKMLARIWGFSNGDLVAAQATYHRSKHCFSKYTSKSINIRSVFQEDNEHILRDSVSALVGEMKPILDNKGVYLLSYLKTQFHKLLSNKCYSNPEAIYFTKLEENNSKGLS